MTDRELIKRLREADSYNKKYYALDPLHKEAADRIEELNERLTAATDDAKEAEAYAEQLEAKLAKAVEALEYYNVAGHEGKEARATLAEIKGESHE